MESKKDKAINKILKDFEKFANLTLEQLDLLDKYMSSDQSDKVAKYYKQIKLNEEDLNNFEVKISENIVNTLALYQPMASDIRKIIACHRIIVNMERIGDLVLTVAINVKKMRDPSIFHKSSELIDNMLIISTQMVQRAMLSFTEDDKDNAIWTIKNDDIVDELNVKLLRKSISKSGFSEEQEEAVYSFIRLKTILASIERIADHATHIAEASIYSTEGTDIRHQDIEDNE